MNEEEQRRKRQEYDRKRRSEQTPEQRQAIIEVKRNKRLLSTPEQREAKIERDRRRRLLATPEQRQAEAERSRRRRLNMNPQQREEDNIRHRRILPPSMYAARDPSHRPETHYLGAMDNRCQDCGALHFRQEQTQKKTFSGCCGSGSVRLQPLGEYPEKFKKWLTEDNEDGRHFRLNIRKYNSAFAFASFGYQPVKFSSGPQPIVIHGQVYHKTAQSLTNTDKPSYAQLYFLDPEFANKERLENEHNNGCREDFFTEIDTTLRQINPYANAYKMMRDVLQEHPTNKQIHMWLHQDRHHDRRRYNLPTANEVAAVFISEDGEPPFDRDICVRPIGQYGLQNIKFYSPNCDPMTYPILFPQGEPGWQPGLQKVGADSCDTYDDDEETPQKRSRNISMLEFYSFRLQRRSTFNQLLHGRKLTQQYIIDAFLKVEAQRLQWNRDNQKTLRADLYLGLMDYVHNQAEQQGLTPGRMVILPSSFTGGNRALQQNYQDAMILVAKFGKPDLFITFTCNPKWKEISEQLQWKETAMDRPDVVASVFQLKLKNFLNDMTCDKGGVLGKVKAFMSVIEFQKRGLPHCHMLFILEQDDKLRESTDVDSVVCAEIPDESDRELFEVVTSCMIHGPCGESNKKAPCMAEEKGCFKCTKNFPKDFAEATDVNVDGYPIYRRRNDGRKVIVNGVDVDNRWVVPYNPYLSTKYQAHINVEVCSSVQSVKYIFKYIYKGHDAAVVKVSETEQPGTYDWDEVQKFLDTRYISAPEAMWRLRKYDMHSRSHSVERLPVHLPWQQMVYFKEGEEAESLTQAERRGTKLTKWFQLNSMDVEARSILYCDIPYHYVWRKNMWKKRQRGGNKILSRMYSVSPKDMERYCLKLLLSHKPGAQSFDDLKTVGGIMHGNFLEAAKAMNLLEDDEEWNKAMEEATFF